MVQRHSPPLINYNCFNKWNQFDRLFQFQFVCRLSLGASTRNKKPHLIVCHNSVTIVLNDILYSIIYCNGHSIGIVSTLWEKCAIFQEFFSSRRAALENAICFSFRSSFRSINCNVSHLQRAHLIIKCSKSGLFKTIVY